ncbi:MAG: aminotransferase class I/II-fold pyridoxal phosphate-dependent enzyme [Treponema sp.]|jgi:histidinol-phosphate aminotransferase|nr:aminotransferase class I/II-fold pyridoxal phosphate-dependent enzyme [Treponema sp.]MBQ2355315.1 aminotransferase class I/II-fold pyridoxal phosphate-dependent enzyme [Treponema sp.]MBQ5432875.1 aminotransferase class I/II-fold pyridoxal phosphate-dependent enzyme [Treponema sp.]MBR6143147.1 aminotransferase class I/II-fold pyridoxal phosphate-dependent enzyme [Treponema sp.]HBB14009.1 histidinol-phosphate aminotransferase [Treponema sp.]
MTEQEFEYLYAVHKRNDTTSFSDELKQTCQKNGWTDGNKITDSGYEALAPYKVDNAIIMAAGRSRRCMPLSNYLPKGLFEIKGDTMVERQIKQMHDAGIKEIVIVVGYLKEKYYEMAKKYPELIVIDNEEWQEKNNISSLYAAKDYIKNSYICCSDNWFAHNVYRDYVYDSYYAAKYSDEFINEDCVKAFDKNGYMREVKRGGEKSWYIIGESFWRKDFSDTFKDLMVKEYYDPEMKYMLWDHFYAKHIDVLNMKIRKTTDAECKEFDTTEEIIEFNPSFKEFVNQFFQEEEFVNSTQRISYLSNYTDVKQYSVVSTEQLTGRMHVNENLFGASPKCLEVFHNAKMEDLCLYDLTREDELALEVSKMLDLPTDNIFVHSGSSDVIKTIMTLVLNKDDTVLISAPAWNYYKSVVELHFAKAAYYEIKPGKDSYEFDVKGLLSKARETNPRIIVITTPHNPTGAVMSQTDVEKIVKQNPSSLVIIDEAYLGFSSEKIDAKHLLNSYNNVVFCRTFSKLYGLAGVRIGYGLCAPMAKQVFKLDLNPFRVSNLGRKAAVAALQDKAYYDNLTKTTAQIRDNFIAQMNTLANVKAFKSAANFVFIHFDNSIDTQKLKDYLAQNGILVRLWTENGQLAMRVTVAPKEWMDKAFNLIKEFLGK